MISPAGRQVPADRPIDVGLEIDHERKADWAEVVRKISAGDAAGGGESLRQLCSALTQAVRPGLRRLVDPESVDDRLHEIVIVVLEAIRSGELRDPGRVMGFVRTVAHRRAIAHIRGAISHRRRFAAELRMDRADFAAPMDQSTEVRMAQREQIAAMLGKLCPRDREILERFYLREEPPLQICREMRLTGTQFRLFKSRAIARCLSLSRRPLRLGYSTKPVWIA